MTTTFLSLKGRCLLPRSISANDHRFCSFPYIIHTYTSSTFRHKDSEKLFLHILAYLSRLYQKSVPRKHQRHHHSRYVRICYDSRHKLNAQTHRIFTFLIKLCLLEELGWYDITAVVTPSTWSNIMEVLIEVWGILAEKCHTFLGWMRFYVVVFLFSYFETFPSLFLHAFSRNV